MDTDTLRTKLEARQQEIEQQVQTISEQQQQLQEQKLRLAGEHDANIALLAELPATAARSGAPAEETEQTTEQVAETTDGNSGKTPQA